MRRFFSWALLIGSAIAAFILAIILTNHGIGQTVFIKSGQVPLLENWVLVLLTILVGISTYILRGIDSGDWSYKYSTLSMILAVIIAFFLFGLYALFTLAIILLLVTPLIIQKANHK